VRRISLVAAILAGIGLTAIFELHRKAQWRLDFVATENAMGFHAPQESARIPGESIDFFRQAQIETIEYKPGTAPAATQAPH
jgi:nitrite reductase (cytochrome c-552)